VSTTREIEVTLVYPAYNEAKRIEQAVTSAVEELIKITPGFEVIIAEDGSTDGTDQIAYRLSTEHPYLRHIHSDERLGRGQALNRAFKQAKGNILVYADVDLATDMTYLEPLIDMIRKGADVATGSRTHPQSTVKRTRRRLLASKTYNSMIRLLFNTHLSDHQCGFKAFSRDRLLSIIDEVEDTHWFWDTETLVIASRHGYRVEEIPITWSESENTKVKLFSDSVRMASQAIRLWWRLGTRKQESY
jgi:glycosyltransferase involved in cell wall biosynthesis